MLNEVNSECEEKDSVGKHEGTVADCVTESFCKICNEKLSGVDKDKHTGKTDVRNKKEATETQEGYTGDTHCTDCDVILIRGEKIAKSSPPEDQENIPTDTGNDINISMLLAVLFVSALFTVILASIKKTNKG